MASASALDVVLRRLAHDTQDVPGIRLYAQPVQDLTMEDRVARTQYQVLLSSADMAQLQRSTAALLERLRAAPELADVASDLQSQGRQAFVQIDRAQASRLGVTVAGIDTALYNAFGQRLISTIFTQSNQYRVVLEVAPQFKLGPEALERIYVPSSLGAPVPLASVARIEERSTALAVNHVGQLPAATHLVQHRAGRVAGRCGPGHRSAPTPRCRARAACRCRWRWPFRARRWPSRLRCPTRCC